jgi:fructosamine-3-kinase
MQAELRKALQAIGDDTQVIRISPVTGGSINRTFYVRTELHEYFVKYNENVPEDFFRQETYGLRLLKKAKAVSVPEVYGDFVFGNRVILIMEWIQGSIAANTEERLGKNLALLHQCYGRAFGLDHNNYIGIYPQFNGWSQSWVDFYRDKRLRVQWEIGRKKGTIQGERARKLEKLLEQLPKWIPNDVKPSLLHGDLWSGNWMVGPNGEPYLIDPAVFFGHSEMEIAFTEVFKGFSSTFYRAYEEVLPLDMGYFERKRLYQLYYLLVHLNLFGETYGSSVDRILNYYV